MLDYDTEREKRGEQVTATSFARFHASHGEKDTAQALLLRDQSRALAASN